MDKDNSKVELPISREALYELAWSEPMTSIGKRVDVSSSYLARVFTRLNIPRPPVGYWAKIEAGKTVPKPHYQILKLEKMILGIDTTMHH